MCAGCVAVESCTYLMGNSVCVCVGGGGGGGTKCCQIAVGSPKSHLGHSMGELCDDVRSRDWKLLSNCVRTYVCSKGGQLVRCFNQSQTEND